MPDTTVVRRFATTGAVLLAALLAGCAGGGSDALESMARNCDFGVDEGVSVQKQARGDGGVHNDYDAAAIGVSADHVHLPGSAVELSLSRDQCSTVEDAASTVGLPASCRELFPGGSALRLHSGSRACYVSKAVNGRITIVSSGASE